MHFWSKIKPVEYLLYRQLYYKMEDNNMKTKILIQDNNEQLIVNKETIRLLVNGFKGQCNDMNINLNGLDTLVICVLPEIEVDINDIKDIAKYGNESDEYYWFEIDGIPCQLIHGVISNLLVTNGLPAVTIPMFKDNVREEVSDKVADYMAKKEEEEKANIPPKEKRNTRSKKHFKSMMSLMDIIIKILIIVWSANGLANNIPWLASFIDSPTAIPVIYFIFVIIRLISLI